MRSGNRWLALGCVAVLAGTANGCDGGADRSFLSIGTGGTGGIFYPMGGALASQMSAADSLRRYTAEVTGGSVENLNRVASREMDLGFTISTTMYESHFGESATAETRRVRAVAPLYPSVVHIVVRSRDDISTVAGFRGQRVSVGSAGSGTEQAARQILAAHGLSYDDVDAKYLSFRESADAMRDGAIDAAFIVAGFPAAAVLEITTAGVGRLIGIAGGPLHALVTEFPYYFVGAVPPNAYPGVETSVPTLAVMNWLVGHEALSGEVVELLLNVLESRRGALEAVHPIAGQIDLSVLGDAPPIPLHEASARWYARDRQ